MGWVFWLGFTNLDPQMSILGKALTFFLWPYMLGVEVSGEHEETRRVE